MAKAKCSICGQEYDICNSCLDQKTFKPWRRVTDSIEHYKIYLAIHGYTLSNDKEKAKSELGNCDLSGLNKFNPEIKSVIEKIMKEPKKSKAVPQKIADKEDSQKETSDNNNE